MVKLVKGDIAQNIITDDDVIITSSSKMGKTLCEVLNEQQLDIDKLKSNVKYIYAYGGVGGTGSGGAGSGSTEKPISILVTLNALPVNNNGNTIILDGRGRYKLYVRISNAGGKNLLMGYTTDGSVVDDSLIRYHLNGDNKYKGEIELNLNGNGVLNVAISDDEGNIIEYYSQKYIVDSDTFNVTLNYIDIYGKEQQYVNEPYECFISDTSKKNRYFKIDYSIFLPEYNEVKIEASIDGIGKIFSSDENLSNVYTIPLDKILIDGESILQNKHMGIYTLRASLSYKIEGKDVVRHRNLSFNIIPSGLYVNVRTPVDVLYDDVDGILNSIRQGSSLMMYCKVFEGKKDSSSTVMYDVAISVFNSNGFDENGYPIWEENPTMTKIEEGLVEQIESTKGISITFPTYGIKKIEISTIGKKEGLDLNIRKTFVKYVKVEEYTASCKWYNDNRYTVYMDSYFKANQEIPYQDFPALSSGIDVLSLNTSSSPIELTSDLWLENGEAPMSTVITFGIQVSDINSEDANIVEIYPNTHDGKVEYTLSTTRLFSNDNNKIAIPTESLNKDDNRKYHLVQIIRNMSLYGDADDKYEESLYIDGLLESVNRDVKDSTLFVKKIILKNINICYNLINVQYFAPICTDDKVGKKIKFNPDEYAYRYWLSYKEKYINSDLDERLTREETFIEENMYRIAFDGVNVVIDGGMDDNIIVEIARRSNLPSIVFGYDCNGGKISDFMNSMWRGNLNGNDGGFGNRKIDLYWIPENANDLNKTHVKDYIVNIPQNFSDNNGISFGGNWQISLQGTSTMRNRIKNYSLRIDSGDKSEKILFSPKFNIGDGRTFLPDLEWTIKADIADSAHANNTSIGKFVNDFCTQIDTNISDATPQAKKFIKNTLEGIPVLLYFMCAGKDDEGNDSTKIYYFGIYNFNLGRKSYYNLGYAGGIVDAQKNESDFMRVFNNIEQKTPGKYYTDGIFTFAVGDGMLNENIIIGEIQDNYAEFDFHQCDETVLFNEEGVNRACMFGTNDKIITKDIAIAKPALKSLVRSIAKAGRFCFDKIGRRDDFRPSKSLKSDNCINVYADKFIPDSKYQMKYVDNSIEWSEDSNLGDASDIDLKNLIIEYKKEDDTYNNPILNFVSASEYYTICMAFGMVDSVLKNMNLKNFKNQNQGYNFHCAFYDMDCALEEANDGQEKISYLAATDYWYSPYKEGLEYIETIKQYNDYWDIINGGQGFDFTSSYLFAIVKYAKSIFNSYVKDEDRYDTQLIHYPQNFWAMLRRPPIENDEGGGLQNVDYFMENYFKSGVTTTFEYLASLNYRVKYLYYGQILGSNNATTDNYIANVSAFNGSRRIKVKNWLTKRLRFLDLMMNVNDLKVQISSSGSSSNTDPLYYPGPGSYSTILVNNPDITILHSAFDDDNLNTSLATFNDVEVEIEAPKHTPFIHRTGSSKANVYLLPGGVDKKNIITFSTSDAATSRFFGSELFTNVNRIETMLTSRKAIVSDNIEKITYSGLPVGTTNKSGGLKINAKSVREIDLNIPNMGGLLEIDKKCISLTRLNIANSSFYGDFGGFPSLKEVNISGVSGGAGGNSNGVIKVYGSDFLTGEKFRISGSNEKQKTSLTELTISGVTGNFNCNNTDIGVISITNNTDRSSSFTINGDNRLSRLELYGFKEVSITNCNNLTTLIIDDALESIYINGSKLSNIFLNTDGGDSEDETGTFNFTNYSNLNEVTLINCEELVCVKLPDRNIKTQGMRNNPKLKWIDTGVNPSFSDVKEYKSEDGNITYKKYGDGYKLILCSDKAFLNCPNYVMLRSEHDKYDNPFKELTGNNTTLYAYTNIVVSEDCTNLGETFCMTGTADVNLKHEFNMDTAIRFIEKCVPDEVKKNITSLYRCFYGRKDVEYVQKDSLNEVKNDKHKHPSLKDYTALNNISQMYYNTNVKFVSKNLLDLDLNENSTDKVLDWDNFISDMSNMNITSDALHNISYRLNSYSNKGFKNIYEYNSDKGEYQLVGSSESEKFEVIKFFGPKYDDNNKVVPLSHIKEIESLHFGDQYINFNEMFLLFPNVEKINRFLHGNLSKYDMGEILKPCTNIISITESFKDNSGRAIIDLFNFFNSFN